MSQKKSSQNKEKILGKGSFSSVYRTSSRPGVVIKRPNPSDKNFRQIISKYRKQKDMLDTIRTQHAEKKDLFNQVYQIADNQSIMKDLGNMNLEFYIRKMNPWLIYDIDNVMNQLKDGMLTMISSGVVHRDIKPENIMATYGSDGKFYLTFIDFVDSMTTQMINEKKKFDLFGTRLYMSPELISRRCEKNFTNPSQPELEYISNDLWALGVVMYMVLFKEHPFVYLSKLPKYDRYDLIHYNNSCEVNDIFHYFREYSQMYNDLFPQLNPNDRRYKYLKDVKTLMSLNPHKRWEIFLSPNTPNILPAPTTQGAQISSMKRTPSSITSKSATSIKRRKQDQI